MCSAILYVIRMLHCLHVTTNENMFGGFVNFFCTHLAGEIISDEFAD
jgi:hypothetical protein